ncbi:hypothetical protein 2 [Gerbera anandria sobemo-like virus]|nr:hypothetical protein 2 [Gerbera anandria sobemo-like virus]
MENYRRIEQDIFRIEDPERRFILEKLVENVNIPYICPKIENGTMPRDVFDDIIRNKLTMTSSVGYTMGRRYTTIAKALGWNGLTMDMDKVEDLWQLVSNKVAGFVLNSEIDWAPMRVFIKDELHKPDKWKMGRWRLIMAGDVVDQIIDRWLFQDMNNKIIDQHWNLPLKVGFTPYWGESEKVCKMFKNPLAIDKKAWDWTLPGSVLDLWMEYRLLMMVGRDERVVELIKDRYDYMMRRTEIVLSNGKRLRQTSNGIMKSGWFNTIVDNSAAQYILHLYAAWPRVEEVGEEDWIDKFVCMGDDTLQEEPPSEYLQTYLERLRSTGAILKDPERDYLFAGFNIRTIIPEYWEKHKQALMRKGVGEDANEIKAQMIESYQRLYFNDERKFGIIQMMAMQYQPLCRVYPSCHLKLWARDSSNRVQPTGEFDDSRVGWTLFELSLAHNFRWQDG